ncbi:ABC transporter ATP-binding protein [bacterium]|jgi:multidrug/hemolysin transport system ATP-binding protein|nr:ABC transporter ATP-binding protein [bacterium]
MESIIEIKNLNKAFGSIKAVQDLSFKVKKGDLFAFLGVNGAGKSTTINIMCGQLAKDSGQVVIDNYDLDKQVLEIKQRIGVVFQTSVLDQGLNVYDNLRSRAALYGISGPAFKTRLAELSKLLDLDSLLKREVSKLSGGQRRRVDIARALLHKPKILILDEPTTGLDPKTRRIIWRVINDSRSKRGTTVFLTTHYMEEASEADYIVIIDNGKTAAEGRPIDLKNRYTGDFITLYDTEEALVNKLGLEYQTLRDSYRIEVKDTTQATELILKHPEIFKDYEIIKGKMDDVFLTVTGKKLPEGNDK